jgi:uncharacterized membrane protein
MGAVVTVPMIRLLHAIATTAMAGVIWTVQLVIYPLFAGVGEEVFTSYHADYSERITWIVGPLMTLELGCALVLAIVAWKSGEGRFFAATGLLLVVALWLVTALIQVPQHGRLNDGYDATTIAALVAGNWIRTVLWTLRVPMAWRMVSGG